MKECKTPWGTLRIYKSHGEWRWQVRAKNGKKLANGGEGYKNEGDCRKAIGSVAAMLSYASTAGVS